MKRLPKIVFLTIVLTWALGGCMKMGPEYRRPDIGVDIPVSYQQGSKEKTIGIDEDRWWEVFKNPEINRLVEEVLENNLDIQKATARILELRSRLVQTRADRFPSLNIQEQSQTQRSTITSSLSSLSTSQTEYRLTSDTHSLSLPASFEVDLWGRLARAEEAARADLLEAEENRFTLGHSIVAETISLYLEIESIERRIQITEKSIEAFKRSRDFVQNRYDRGLSSILDLRQARRILAQAEAALPVLRQELGVNQQNLAVLLGRYPETRPPKRHPEDYYRQPAPVPHGLPSELLLRRPDIRAAEAQLKALTARIGVAQANRFPRITLTGSFGYTSDELGQVLDANNDLWSMALGILQPLYDAGNLKAGQRAAEARYQQAAADYAKTVLSAFSEVERALLTRKEQLERRDRFLKFLEEARATQEVAESRYTRGLVDYLSVLDAQQTRFQAEENLALVDLAILSNRVALHRALGGAWGRPYDIVVEKKGRFEATPFIPTSWRF